MESDDKFWLYIWLVLGIVVVIIFTITVSFIYCNNRQFIKSGYEKRMLVGSPCSQWQKITTK